MKSLEIFHYFIVMQIFTFIMMMCLGVVIALVYLLMKRRRHAPRKTAFKPRRKARYIQIKQLRGRENVT